MAKKLHLGFKETQAKITKKQGISMKAAGAILASSARKASPAAVRKNKALMNVPGVKPYKDGGKTGAQIKAEGIALKQKGIDIKKKGLEIKDKGRGTKPEPKTYYKKSYTKEPISLDSRPSTYNKKVQVLNKGSKTIVTKRGFIVDGEAHKYGTDKSTAIYDKKTKKFKYAEKHSKAGFDQHESIPALKKGGKISKSKK